MNKTPALVSVSCPTASLAALVWLTAVLRRYLTDSQDMIAARRGRARFRWELKRMAKDNRHLIDDIGMTRRQVEAEIAKPFWQR